MIRVKTDRLVDDYLRRLENAAAHLPRARRAELMAEIREHIDSALRDEDRTDEAAVRNVLDRLGAPEEIAEAAGSAADPPARVGRLEVAALVALVVPFLGWVIGAVLVLVSRAWSQKDKLIGLLLLFVPILVLGLGLTLTATSGGSERVPSGDDREVGVREDASPEGLGPLELVVFVNGIPSALYLAWRLRPERRRDSTGI